jgi:hypothetical protein
MQLSPECKAGCDRATLVRSWQELVLREGIGKDVAICTLVVLGYTWIIHKVDWFHSASDLSHSWSTVISTIFIFRKQHGKAEAPTLESTEGQGTFKEKGLPFYTKRHSQHRLCLSWKSNDAAY